MARCDVIDQIYKTSLEDGKRRMLNVGIEHYLCQKGNHDVLKRFRNDVFSKYDCVVIGENAFMTYNQGKEFMNGELDMFFQFDHMGVDKASLPVFHKKFKTKNLRYAMFEWQKEVDWNANYLENHDQLRSINRFGNPKYYYLESGKALATLLISIKGTPFIYNGQEIGMLNYEDIDLNDIQDVAARNVRDILKKFHFPKYFVKKLVYRIDRDNSRSPMQWNRSKNAGFSSADSTWLKVNNNYLNGLNVEDELKDKNSILNFYKQLINLRNKDEVLQFGEFEPINGNKNFIEFYRELDGKKYYVIISLSSKNIKQKNQLKLERIISNYEVDCQTIIPPYYAAIYEVK